MTIKKTYEIGINGELCFGPDIVLIPPVTGEDVLICGYKCPITVYPGLDMTDGGRLPDYLQPKLEEDGIYRRRFNKKCFHCLQKWAVNMTHEQAVESTLPLELENVN